MRLFVAVRPDAAVSKALLGVMHEMKKNGVQGSYVPAQNLHMTLAFIGETDRTADVKKALSQVAVPEVRLALTESGMFGDLLYAGIKGNQKLKGLVRDIRAALDREGISYDRQPFTPHITMIRKVKGRTSSVRLPKAEMTAASFSLMKSEQKDGRTVYREICSVPG